MPVVDTFPYTFFHPLTVPVMEYTLRTSLLKSLPVKKKSVLWAAKLQKKSKTFKNGHPFCRELIFTLQPRYQEVDLYSTSVAWSLEPYHRYACRRHRSLTPRLTIFYPLTVPVMEYSIHITYFIIEISSSRNKNAHSLPAEELQKKTYRRRSRMGAHIYYYSMIFIPRIVYCCLSKLIELLYAYKYKK